MELFAWTKENHIRVTEKMSDKNIFIVGTITNSLSKEFKEIEKSIKKDLGNKVISTYDKSLSGKKKIEWVFEKINDSEIIIALFPHASFGTSFELGYSIAKEKKVILITSESIYEELKEHPVIYSNNLFIINYKEYEEIKRFIQNL